MPKILEALKLFQGKLNQPTPQSVPRKKQASLKHNFYWALAGTFSMTASQWAVMSALAKLTSAVVVGQVSLALGIVGPLLLALNMHLRYILSTDIDSEHCFGYYAGLRSISVLLLVVLSVSLAFCFHMGQSLVLMVACFSLLRVFDSASDLVYGLLQRHERMAEIAKSQVMQGALQLVGLVLVLKTTREPILGVLAMAAVSSAVFFFYDLRNAAHQLGCVSMLKPSWEPLSSIKLLRTGFPMGLTMALGGLLGNVPRYFLAESAGAKAVGLYAAVSYIAVAGSTFTSALTDSFLPKLALFAARRDVNGFYRLTKKLLMINIVISVLAMFTCLVFGRQLLALLYKPEYGRETELLLWLMVSAVFNNVASAFGCATTSMRVFDIQVYFKVFSLLANVFLCSLLIPGHGVIGAAWAMLGGAITSFFANIMLFFISVNKVVGRAKSLSM